MLADAAPRLRCVPLVCSCLRRPEWLAGCRMLAGWRNVCLTPVSCPPLLLQFEAARLERQAKNKGFFG